jgi:hypothetical protein
LLGNKLQLLLFSGVRMRKKKTRFACHSCGKEVECSSGELPCEALEGWLTVCYWEGPGMMSNYNFCSFTCAKSWVDSQVPKIPAVFLESFGEDKPG